MNTVSTNNWEEANQRYLLAAFSPVRNALQRYIARMRGDLEAEKQQGNPQQELDEAMSVMPAPPALTKLCAAFGLSPFERDVLLLCAGMDLDGTFSGMNETRREEDMQLLPIRPSAWPWQPYRTHIGMHSHLPPPYDAGG